MMGIWGDDLFRWQLATGRAPTSVGPCVCDGIAAARTYGGKLCRFSSLSIQPGVQAQPSLGDYRPLWPSMDRSSWPGEPGTKSSLGGRIAMLALLFSFGYR